MKNIKSLTIRLFAVMSVFATSAFFSAKPVSAALLSCNNEAAVAYYYSLPDSVRYKLESRGVNFEVNDSAVYSLNGGYGNVCGLTHSRYQRRTNKLVSQAVYVRYGKEESIIHEAGHCMASYNNIFEYWTNNIGWQTIYEAEVGNAVAAGMNCNNLYNRNEFFAECFELYLTNPWALQSYCPQAFTYMQAVLMAP